MKLMITLILKVNINYTTHLKLVKLSFDES